jgi:hypothetical protein
MKKTWSEDQTKDNTNDGVCWTDEILFVGEIDHTHAIGLNLTTQNS